MPRRRGCHGAALRNAQSLLQYPEESMDRTDLHFFRRRLEHNAAQSDLAPQRFVRR